MIDMKIIGLTVKAAPGCALIRCSALKISPTKNGQAWSTPCGRNCPYRHYQTKWLHNIIEILQQIKSHQWTGRRSWKARKEVGQHPCGDQLNTLCPPAISGIRTELSMIFSRFIRLFCHPSTLILTIVEDLMCKFATEFGRGMAVIPVEALTVKKSDPPTDTPTAADGEVVCSPRSRDKDFKFFTFSLKPEPVLVILGPR